MSVSATIGTTRISLSGLRIFVKGGPELRTTISLWLAIGLSLAVTVRSGVAETASDILNGVVGLRTEIPASARTARMLGTERDGSGIVIDSDGLVLTIGYLILEAMAAQVIDVDGRIVPADILAYDYDTGFGLLRAQQPLTAKPLRFGRSQDIEAGMPVLAVAHGGSEAVVATYVTSRDEFVGYWEYLLDSAIFTAPPHTHYAGAALIGDDGRLLGVGSLYVNDPGPNDERRPGNMFVPIALLRPILADLLVNGRSSAPPRPWLGMFSRQIGQHVVVSRVLPEGPAAEAGIDVGDLVVGVGKDKVTDLADMFRKVWALGDAGVSVPLVILRDGGLQPVTVKSGDRYDYLRMNPTY